MIAYSHIRFSASPAFVATKIINDVFYLEGTLVNLLGCHYKKADVKQDMLFPGKGGQNSIAGARNRICKIYHNEDVNSKRSKEGQ